MAVPWRLGVSGLDTPPQFVGRHVEVVQFDTDAKTTSRGSHLVTFDPCPQPKVEDDTQAEAQDLLGETPKFVVDLLPGRFVPGGGAEGPKSFILSKAHGTPVRSELPGQYGLA